MKFYKLPYNSWSLLNHQHLDFVRRFEDFVNSFEEVLGKMEMKPVHRLLLFNKTGDKKKHFTECYSIPEVRRRAVKVFGPYMHRWDYEFPKDWTEAKEVNPNESSYHMVSIFRKVYWKFFR